MISKHGSTPRVTTFVIDIDPIDWLIEYIARPGDVSLEGRKPQVCLMYSQKIRLNQYDKLVDMDQTIYEFN